MKIKDIASVVSESVPYPAESGFEKFVGLEHYDAGEPKITRYGSTDMLKTAMKHFLPGDVLVARRNVYLRRAGIVDFEGLTSGDSIVLRPQNDDIARYLPFILNSNAFWDFADANSDGTMSKRLSPKTLLDYEFDLPPIEEQRVLADKLWAAYRLKESYRRLLTATQEMVKSQFIEMFGDKDFKHTNLEDIVAKDCSLSYGIVQPGEGVDDGVPVVRPVDLTQDVVSPDNLKMTTKEIAQSYKRTTLKGGELLLCVRGTTGVISKASLSLKGANVTRGIVPIWFKNCIDKQFMFYQMKSDAVQKQIKENTYGTTLLQINIKNLRKIDLILPPIELQQQFVAIAEQADKSGFELRKSIEAIDNVIKSLINNQS